MSWNLRAAVAKDVRCIAAVDAAASLHPWAESQFCIAPGGDGAAAVNSFIQSILVAQCKGLLCGFIVYSRVLDEAEILNIAVHPAHQNQGIARDLLVTVLQGLQADGVARCLLEVRVSNAPARGLYESLEFKPDGVRNNYYPAGNGREDALLMSMLLSEVSKKRMPL